MLGKLFSHELRALWKPAAIMLAIMVAAGLAGTACLASAQAAGSAAGSVNAAASMFSDATVVLYMGALFCGFFVWAAVAALYVFVAMRFYRSLFTDEGYLTLTLPVRTGTLVMAKFWAAYLLLALFAFAAMGLYSLMAGIVSEGELGLPTVLSLTGGWFSLAADNEATSALMGLINTLVTCAYSLGLAFGSLTLGAWWARRHKVAAAVGIYLGVGWVISLVFSVVGVLGMTGDTQGWDVVLGAVSAAQLVVNLAVAACALALSAYLLRAKVDLS